MAKIAAVICTYNRYDVLKYAVDSLLIQTLPKSDYEIWIIDNTPGAEKGQGKEFSRLYEHIENLNYYFEKTPGLSNARNVAIKNTDTPYIAYLDDDAIAGSQWLEEVINGFETFSNVGVVGGRISPIWEIPRPTWLSDALAGNVSVVDWGGSLRVAAEGEWFAGANIAFSREVLEQSGGFSVNLGRKGAGQILLSNEENEILEFVKKSNFQEVYNPLASVDHLVEKNRLRRAWFRRRAAWQAVSDFMLMPEKMEAQLPGMLQNLRGYLSAMPPLYRNIQGLFYETDDADLFQWQLSAIYGITTLNLAGFDGVEDV
jgi:glycosyltransferase involved in cell wall biosynthesis